MPDPQTGPTAGWKWLDSDAGTVSPDEPDTYAAGAWKGLKEGVAGGAKGFVEGLIDSPGALMRGVGTAFTQSPATTIKETAAAVGRIPAAVQAAGADPEGWGRDVGTVTGTTLLTEGVPLLRGVPAARAALVEPAGAVVKAVAKRFGVDADALALKATKMDLQRARSQTRIAKIRNEMSPATAPTASPEPLTALPSSPSAEVVKTPIPLDQAVNVVHRLASADKIKVPAQDFTNLTALVKEGYPQEQVWAVYKAHKAAETLATSLGTPTEAEVASNVAVRNATGRW